MLPVIGMILVGLAIVYTAEAPPSWGCGAEPGRAQEDAITAYRALAFSLTGLIALGVGVMAARWSRDRRVRRGDGGRPGWPTILSATVPVLLLALVLLSPDTFALYTYFIYAAFAGFFLVPAMLIAGFVIAFAGERWRSDRALARLDAATIAIADGLIVLGLPLASWPPTRRASTSTADQPGSETRQTPSSSTICTVRGSAPWPATR